jgi:hypothetical protein
MANALGYKYSLDWSGTATEAIPAYSAVVIDYSAGTISLTASQGAIADGFVVTAIGSGEQGQVILDGVVPVKIGTASNVVKGDLLTPDNGTGAVSEAASGDVAVAQCLVAPNANGDVVLARILTNKVTI